MMVVMKESFPTNNPDKKNPELKVVEGSDIGYGPSLEREEAEIPDDGRRLVENGDGGYDFRELTPEEEAEKQQGIRDVLKEIGVIGKE